jgi:hypothetical protein
VTALVGEEEWTDHVRERRRRAQLVCPAQTWRVRIDRKKADQQPPFRQTQSHVAPPPVNATSSLSID